MDAFSSAVLFYDNAGEHASNWTKSIFQCLQEQNFDEVPFRVPQLLEPAVLDDVAYLNGLSAADIESYSYDLHGPILTLKWLHDMLKWATPVQRLNLAVCLSATCRYRAAQDVFETIPYHSLYTDQKVAYHMAKFVIDNRLDRTSLHQSDFTLLKEIIETESVPPERILDVSSQAIVWGIKGACIDRSLLDWFADTGKRTAELLANTSSGKELIALSSFYRGYAMIPAVASNAPETRKHMALAEHYADSVTVGPGVSEISLRDVKKTVLESKLKEMLYVARDPDQARLVGHELIDVDRNWSISYHELGEVEISEGRFDAALKHFERALDVGLPRLTFSQYMIGACLEQLGRRDEAVSAYKLTLELDPSNISAGVSGYKIAKTHLNSDLLYFQSYIDKWSAAGLLSSEHRGMTQ